MSEQQLKPAEAAKPIRQAIWQFTFGDRSSKEEKAFRAHYLVDDIQQLTAITLFAVGFMLCLSVIDAINLGLDPLPDGLLIRSSFIVVGVAVVAAVRTIRRPWIVDIGAALYSTVLALGLLLFHYTGDVNITRIAVVVTLFNFMIHLAFATYAVYLLLPVIVLLCGDGYLIYMSSDSMYVENRNVVMAVIIASALSGVVGSALLQRSRYHAFTAMQQVKTLSGLLPICASCKKIRNDDGFYQQIELYIREHSYAEFTHGICPDCAESLMKEPRTAVGSA